MEKVVLVKSKFKSIQQELPIQEKTEKKTLGVFKKSSAEKQKRKINSNCAIDSERLEADLQTAINQLNQEGYRVKTITPIISGNYDYNYKLDYTSPFGRSDLAGAGCGFGYGYSYTDGLLIIAEKTAESIP